MSSTLDKLLQLYSRHKYERDSAQINRKIGNDGCVLNSKERIMNYVVDQRSNVSKIRSSDARKYVENNK